MSETGATVAASTTAVDSSQTQANPDAIAKELTAKENLAEPSLVSDPSKESKETKAKRERKIKIDGKEETVNLDDYSDEEKLLKELQLSKVAQKRMAEKAEEAKARKQLEAEVQEFLGLLKTDPRKVLTDPNIGIDLKKLAEEIMAEELERASKDPKELELEEAKKELERFKKEKEEEKARLEKDYYESLVQQHANRIETDITNALNTSSLPQNPQLISRVAQYMQIALEQNINVGVNDIVPIVMSELQNDVKQMIKVLKPDQIKSLFGDVVDNIRKEDIQKIKKVANLTEVKDVGMKDAKAKEQEKQSIRQWLKR